MRPLDGVSTVALIFLFSFAIERIVRGILFCLAWFDWFDPEADPDEEPEDRVKRNRPRAGAALSFALSAAGASAILWAFELSGILSILGLKSGQHWLDFILTVLVLASGADRLGEVMKSHGAPKASAAPPPLVVTGTLHFDESSIRLKAGNPQAGLEG